MDCDGSAQLLAPHLELEAALVVCLCVSHTAIWLVAGVKAEHEDEALAAQPQPVNYVVLCQLSRHGVHASSELAARLGAALAAGSRGYCLGVCSQLLTFNLLTFNVLHIS